jgi:esterase/lipase superfamily enzyme
VSCRLRWGGSVRAALGSRCSIHWAVIALLAIALAGCVGRPGPEVLAPVAALPGAKTLPIYVATTREREGTSENVFTSNRANSLNFAKFVVSVPPSHKPGNVELPTSSPDPQTSFAVVDQAVMSEADFRNTVAPQSTARRKKHKIFLFVHGFNNNFQESLFRLAQLQADAQIDGIPVLFAWPGKSLPIPRIRMRRTIRATIWLRC